MLERGRQGRGDGRMHLGARVGATIGRLLRVGRLPRMPVFQAIVLCVIAPGIVASQAVDTIRVAYSPARCQRCAAWNAPQDPFRIFGNTYYVGTHGLSSILITSDRGHVLIDGALPTSAPIIVTHIRALGFQVEDVKLILNSHPHFDHAGGIAELRATSGARVAASAWSASVIERGESDRQDPQYGMVNPFPPEPAVRVIRDGETLRVGPLALVAHFTPGHTPGGTSWSWRSCDAARCADFLYADSQTAVSSDDFYFTRSSTYPSAEADFTRGINLLRRLPCQILLTPHPEAARLFERVAARDSVHTDGALIDPQMCRQFVADARAAVAKRIAKERATSSRASSR